MRPGPIALRVGLAVGLLFFSGCHRAKRAKCEAILVQWWGPQAAQDPAYASKFVDRCVGTPDDVIDCLRANATRAANGKAADPACNQKLKEFERSSQTAPHGTPPHI